jgi:hypothetical protein
MQQPVKTDVFIVRIWKEPREQQHARTVWRGSVEHVASKAIRHIGELSDLVDFVRETAGWDEDRPDAGSR